MKMRAFIGKISVLAMFPVVALVTSSCKEVPKVVEIDARRDLCQFDDPTVYKGAYDAWLATQPLEWRRVSRTEFRLLNYAAGEETQIAVGQVDGGGILANMNRWKREFGQEVLENIDGLEKIEMLGGRRAYVIQLKGTYQTKMSGMPVKAEDWAVTGVICDIGGGSLLTVKMMGPEAEVKAQQENLMKFIKSIRVNSLQTPSERSKKDAKMDAAEGGGY